MATPILLTGGTGTLGRHVTPRLHEAGYKVRILSRTSREATDGVEFVTGDLSTGEGLDAAVTGVDTVIHCAGEMKGDDEKARNLVRAASGSGVQHVIYISVVGADRIPVSSRMDQAMFGYFSAKRAAEEVIADSGVPWTTLRATQFHDLALLTVRQLTKLPVVPVPSGWRLQPIDADEVAARLVELALGSPSGFVPPIGGPHIYSMADLVRSYLQAAGKHRLLMPVKLPGGAARAYRDGANLAPDRAVGNRTWEDFLATELQLAGS